MPGMSRSNFGKFTSVFFLVLGATFACAGGVWAWKTWSFVSSANATLGVVEALEERTSKERVRIDGSSHRRRLKTRYAPVFRFRDEQGREHSATAGVFGSEDDYAIGGELPVLYDPRDPQVARIDSFQHLWLFPSAIGGLGMVFVGSALFSQRR